MGVMNRFMNFLGLQDEEEWVERDSFQEGDYEEDMAPATRKNNKNNVVSLHSQKPQQKMVLSEPRSYDEAQEVADHLRARRPVVINLQRVRSEHALRIIDFLSGTVYALNGQIHKVGSNIFLCTPETIDIQGSITEMLAEDDERKKSR